jgi:nucleotide-binding universal stress UspA family protein
VKILIATDGGAEAEHALKTACTLLPMTDAEVVLVSVIDPELRVGANEDADHDLTHAQALLAARGVAARGLVRRGAFGDEIAACARELSVDLVVLGSGSRGGLARWIGGSTVDVVLGAWTGATLVVRHPD